MAEQTLSLVCTSPSLHRGEHCSLGDKVTVSEIEAAIMISSNRWSSQGTSKAAAAIEAAAASTPEAPKSKPAAKS